MRGGAGRGQGRPKGSKSPRTAKLIKRETVKQVRWTADEWDEIVRCSAAADETPSEFIRSAALDRCRKMI